MNFGDEKVSNSLYSSMTISYGKKKKILFESVSEFLLCLIVSTSMLLTTVSLMKYTLIIV